MSAEMDKEIDRLIAIVQQKKEEISKAQKPSWVTNCSFGYDKDSAKRINVQLTNDLDELAHALAFLMERKDSWKAAREILGLPETEFKWLGYTLEEWQEDFSTRISKVTVKEKQKELNQLEARLDKIISPEKRREMEMAAIKAALDG